MTYQTDCTLPEELLEQITQQVAKINNNMKRIK